MEGKIVDDLTVVTNRNDQDAPADLVVLVVTPKELNSQKQEMLLGIDWYRPDPEFYPGREEIIFVQWEQLRPIWNAVPEAPADYGFDPLSAVEYVDKNLRFIGESKFHCV